MASVLLITPFARIGGNKMNSVNFSRDYLNQQLELATEQHRKFVVLNSKGKNKSKLQILLGRDFDLENKTLNYIESKIACEEIVSRYKLTEANFRYLTNGLARSSQDEICLELPESAAFNYIGGSNDDSFYSILTDSSDSYYNCSLKTDKYNFEFVEAWENIFVTTILPCVKQSFSISSYELINRTLFSKLDRAIYINSLFHDLGHQVGPWKSTTISKSVSGLKAFEFRILSELFADTEQILNLNDFPEIQMLIVLQKLFWFGRRKYQQDKDSGAANTDSDAWLGLFLWNKLSNSRALVRNPDGRLEYDHVKATQSFEEIYLEIKSLYLSNFTSTEKLSQAVKKWMFSSVNVKKGKFIYSNSYKTLLQQCSEISDNPKLLPTFNIIL